jgi:YD repeat-containing protein
MGYDARGRLTTRTSTVLGMPFTFSQTYTPGGRVESVTYPSGRALNYTRDLLGRMEGLSSTDDLFTKELASGMTYNPFGGPKGMNTGAGGEVDNRSGECGCIEVANPGSQMEMAYLYDDNRNLLSLTAPNVPWMNQSFTYDALNRLIQAQGRYGEIAYTYDKVGNRLSRTMNGREEGYAYFPGTNRIQGITGENPLTYLSDAAGNVTAVGGKTLIYNQHHRLTRVEEAGQVLGEYTYNGLGQRVTKEVDGTKTVFLYDFNGNLIGEADEGGNITTEYLYMGKIRIAKADATDGSLYFYLNDRLGTPQLMTDETNTVVWGATYKPFGQAEINPNSTVENYN